MKQYFKYAFAVIFLSGILVSCVKEYESIEVIDDRNVKEYIQKNSLSVQEYNGSGIYYQVVSPGLGAEVQYSELTPALVTIRSLDGKYVAVDTFSNGNRYYNYLGYFNPEAVRVGIKEVLKKANGTIRIIVPSRLAFGRNGTTQIPGNSSLDIVVKVMEKEKIPKYDDYTIIKYMEKNALTGFSKTNTGIYYKIGQPGTGSPISVDSTVVANYTGKLLNGTIFDRAVAGSEATFALTSVIKGWQQAIPLINQGGSIRMLIPSGLAYGMEGSSPSIPPFSCLDFEVNVTDVK
jgi:FKBP-type peptidyl-prolyl cis-trans isomerase FkpA